ncbi:MAG: thioredoxin family protein [Aequorivita sp.]
MIKIAWSILFTFTVFANLQAQDNRSINWLTFEELDIALKTESKPVFIFFEADWCVYCKKLERVVFKKQDVIHKINEDYYAVKMNVESTDSISFDGVTFENKEIRTKRGGIHELPLLLATRKGFPFTLPVTLIFDEDFKIKERIFNYYTSKELINTL